MNDMVKNLLLWVVIAAVLMTVFQNINSPRENSTLDYSQFLTEVQSGQIKRIETEGFNIYA